MAEADKPIRCNANAGLTFGTEVETVSGQSLGRITVFDPIHDLRNGRPLPNIHSITTDKGYFLRAEDIAIEGNKGKKLVVSLLRDVKPQEEPVDNDLPSEETAIAMDDIKHGNVVVVKNLNEMDKLVENTREEERRLANPQRKPSVASKPTVQTE
jgi:hypothetical protein